ncbi:hypothetical protein DL98DRAFT_662526 [Cadophora sp. DSE1049]|nr:hypothetical protein DL98DRAFT_662526 [Cadophora sp. DSE1049]
MKMKPLYSVQNQINVGLQDWNLVVSFCLALVVSRFPRRRMYLLCTTSLFCIYTGWTVAQNRQMITGSHSAGIAVIAFIFLYQLAYSIGYNALTYVYLVEIFPYFVRAKGISWFQLFGKGAGFFSTFVNPIALDAITWRYLIVYVVWLCFEIIFIYFIFPETYNRTLEELSFLFEPQEAKDAVGKDLGKGVSKTSSASRFWRKEMTKRFKATLFFQNR